MNLGQLEIDEAGLKGLCAKWKISRLEVFGSVLRDDFGPESDVDLLVEFQPNAGLSFRDLFEAESEFSGLIGREVELVSRRGVEASRNFIRRKSILESAVLLYAA